MNAMSEIKNPPRSTTIPIHTLVPISPLSILIMKQVHAYMSCVGFQYLRMGVE